MIEISRKCFRISHMITELRDYIFMDDSNDENIQGGMAEGRSSEGKQGSDVYLPFPRWEKDGQMSREM